MGLGKNVKARREELGLTQDQLSELSGVDVGTISALEVRDSSRSKYAVPLAKALNVSLEDLLSDGGSKGRRGPLPVPPTRWPFTAFTEEQFNNLPERFKGRAEQSVLEIIREWERSKRPGIDDSAA